MQEGVKHHSQSINQASDVRRSINKDMKIFVISMLKVELPRGSLFLFWTVRVELRYEVVKEGVNQKDIHQSICIYLFAMDEVQH